MIGQQVERATSRVRGLDAEIDKRGALIGGDADIDEDEQRIPPDERYILGACADRHPDPG